MPSVQQTAAFSGFRPVAKAFGANVGETCKEGIGCPCWVDNSRTMRYIAGCSASLTWRACMERKASLPLFQYEKPLTPTAMTKAMTRPVVPPNQAPITKMTEPIRPSRKAVFRPFAKRFTHYFYQSRSRSPIAIDGTTDMATVTANIAVTATCIGNAPASPSLASAPTSGRRNRTAAHDR